MKRRARLASLVALLAVVAACANPLERPAIQKQRFALVPGAPERVTGPRAGILRVGVVRVSPPFHNRAIVLRTGEDTMASDFYNEFAAPPGPLLRDLLVEWLREGTHFASVVRGSEAQPDWLLEVDLEEMYADVRDPAAPKAVIRIDARLLRANAPRSGIAFHANYAETEPATTRARAALMDAWNRATARILTKLAADLDRARATAPPPPAH
jgi:uncharacterized lipoprotein YmbA